jgi:Ca2+-binding EF-hand superfamily protein
MQKLAQSYAVRTIGSLLPVQLHIIDYIRRYLRLKGSKLSKSTSLDSLCLNYDEYCQLNDKSIHASLSKVLTPTLFAQFPILYKDNEESISFLSLILYLFKWLRLTHVHKRLLLHDSDGNGYLYEQDFENYIFESLRSLPSYGIFNMQESFFPFYVFTAVRKFFFFLDPNHTGKISVSSCIQSNVLSEWLLLFPFDYEDFGGVYLETINSYLEEKEFELDDTAEIEKVLILEIYESCARKCTLLVDDFSAQTLSSVSTMSHPTNSTFSFLPTSTTAANWFLPTNALHIYSQYLEIDRDQNGMISRAELLHYYETRVSNLVIQRIFECNKTYNGELDYKGYLDFMLAITYRNSTPSMRYFFRLCALTNENYVTKQDIRLLLQHIISICKNTDVHTPPFPSLLDSHLSSGSAPSKVSSNDAAVSNIIMEIFDRVDGNNEGEKYITFSGLQKSGLGYSLLYMMTDVDGYLQYENEEALLSSPASVPVDSM